MLFLLQLVLSRVQLWPLYTCVLVPSPRRFAIFPDFAWLLLVPHTVAAGEGECRVPGSLDGEKSLVVVCSPEPLLPRPLVQGVLGLAVVGAVAELVEGRSYDFMGEGRPLLVGHFGCQADVAEGRHVHFGTSECQRHYREK